MIGRYQRKPLIVTAEELQVSTLVTHNGSTSTGLAGDFLVTEPSGEQYLMNARAFLTQFNLIERLDSDAV